MILLLWACSDYGYTDAVWTDTFQQDAANAVDLLVVVDTSGSMREEQENLGRNFDALLARFAAADVDWQIGVATTDVEDERERGRLQGGDDEVILRGPLGEIDRVAWDTSWGFDDGVSLVLSAGLTAPGTNDDRSSWCAPSTTFGNLAERGTPGVHQLRCNGLVFERPAPGPDLGPRAPVGGDLVFTELHPQSSGDDTFCEWLELTNTRDDTLQLEGLELFDLGRNHAVLPAYELGPRDSVVIGRAIDNPCGAPVDIELPDGMILNDDRIVIHRDLADAADLFAENVAQGVLGTGIEQGLEGARLVLEEPAATLYNANWLREEAKLALLFVSDEDDYSPRSVDAYLNAFAAVKGLPGHRDPARLSVSAVVGKDRPPRPDYASCRSDAGAGAYAERYVAAANRTGGLVESICADDFAPIVSDLGLTLSSLTLEFGLSRRPKPDTLVVDLFEDDAADTLIGTLEQDVDYVYDSADNAIVFTEAQAPPSNTWLRVRYEVAPPGADGSDGDGPDEPEETP